MSTLLSPLTALGSSIRRRSATQIATDQQGQSFTPIAAVYAIRQAYYEASQYDVDGRLNGRLKAAATLPRSIRAVLQPVKPAVEWWRDNLYRGTWTSDGRASASGKPCMIPWEDDAPDELVLAAHQAFTWGNWPRKIRAYSLYGPMLGDVFCEVEVDEARGKVYPVVHHPGVVRALSLNGSDDVIAYRLAVPRWDPNRKQTFLWGKLVTKTRIVTYYDDRPTGFATVEQDDGESALVRSDDVEAETENPFGFVPAVWVNHLHVGAVHGACVIDDLYALIDELNGVQSAIDDYVMRFVRQPIIVGSENADKLRDILALVKKAAATADLTDPNAPRETIPVIPGPLNVSAVRLLENLGLGEAAVHVDRLTQSVERNLPEATVEERLGNKGELTGPGARAIVAPVQRKLDSSVPGYDHGLVRLGQMCCSIGGELANAGMWRPRGQLTEQQQRFLPFTLASFDRGELSGLAIAPRDLVQTSMLERAQEAAAVEALSDPWSMRHAGLSDQDIYGSNPDGFANAPEFDPGILADRQARQAALPPMAEF